MPAFDDELLRVCERVLDDMGFSTDLALIQDVPCILAENELFILSVVAAGSVDDLSNVDEAVSLHFASEVAAANVGEKQWDVYLVLMTSANLPLNEGDTLYRLSYDTHYLRRLVRTNVAPTPEGVRFALRSFSEMPQLGSGAGATDPLTDLEHALREYGVPPESAHRAISSYRTGGEVDDV